ncbi:VWA domain-containing protein [Saccharothrix australiensis]|uniref:von Willebrand factor type A domain-containing protein n=1 Tax=Saccharothrix australiensis TaxID=2072 RepID=A0A495W147_9PSEU|nr:vWA domain-containing protein [Saccharothrix australiensis]RKT55392.1 von Willebrand factor type A domain-containing protein [Saccharothrix australiensis]
MTATATGHAARAARFFRTSLVAVFALTAATAPVSAAGTAGAARQDDPQVQPLHMVVLVDESSSIDQSALDREKEAALLIALGEFAPGSTVSVAGFASDNDADGPQLAVEPGCGPTAVKSAQDRETLSSCVQKLTRREPGQGDGTDHVSALRKALVDLRSAPKDQPKIVFLLTDGNLNVADSPLWGKDNAGDLRNRAARDALRGELANAKNAGVQLWPLGFGADIDEGRLAEFAAGGHQQTCAEKSPPPRATVVADPNDVVRTMLEAFSAARCAGAGALVETTSKPGGTVEAVVDIPAIATDGSIVVFRRDPRIQVSYEDPEGRAVPKSGDQGDSTFQVSGEQDSVEALRVVNPVPGKWKIKLTTPEGGPAQRVTSTVVWQGAARALMTVDNPTPAAGQQVAISVSLQTRRRTVTDPASLSGLTFSAAIGGDGFQRFPVPLADDGRAPDAEAADGVFSGAGTIPAGAGGELRFTGGVSGIGIQGDERTQNGRVASGPARVRAVTRLTTTEPFTPPGGTRAGELSVTNDSGRPRKVRLVVGNPGPGTVVAVSPAVLDLPPSGESKHPFTLQFAENTVIGVNSGVIRVVDDADPDTVWHSLQFTVAVSYPPTLFERLLWLWITLAAVVALMAVFLLARFARRKRHRDVRGLRVQLDRAGRSTSLHAPDKPAQVFRFTAKESDGALVVNHATPAENAYELRRADDGRLVLRHLDGRTLDLRVGHPEHIAPDVELTCHDERRARPPRTRAPRPAAPPPSPPTRAAASAHRNSGPTAGPPADDDLL